MAIEEETFPKKRRNLLAGVVFLLFVALFEVSIPSIQFAGLSAEPPPWLSLQLVAWVLFLYLCFRYWQGANWTNLMTEQREELSRVAYWFAQRELNAELAKEPTPNRLGTPKEYPSAPHADLVVTMRDNRIVVQLPIYTLSDEGVFTSDKGSRNI